MTIPELLIVTRGDHTIAQSQFGAVEAAHASVACTRPC